MKKLLLSFILFQIISVSTIFASHFMDAEMHYECLNSCTYRIYHKAYYDGSGATTTLPPGVMQTLTYVQASQFL